MQYIGISEARTKVSPPKIKRKSDIQLFLDRITLESHVPLSMERRISVRQTVDSTFANILLGAGFEQMPFLAFPDIIAD